MLRRIGCIISKGGVGKSTTAANLASALARLKYKTLLIDADTQGNLSYMLGVDPAAGLSEFLLNEQSFSDCITEARENLFILAGGYRLGAVKNVIAQRDMRPEFYVREMLQDHDSDYDFIVIDSSPGWDALNINLMFYVNELLVPVSVEVMTLRSLVNFLKQNVERVKQYSDLEVKYILPTFVDGRVSKSTEILDQLKKHFGDLVADPIRYNVKLSECWGWGKNIFEYAASSPGAIDYINLTKRILKDGS